MEKEPDLYEMNIVCVSWFAIAPWLLSILNLTVESMIEHLFIAGFWNSKRIRRRLFVCSIYIEITRLEVQTELDLKQDL